MDKEQAINYLRSSGFSDEQIKAIEGAFSCPSAGVDCEDCPAYENKSEWEHDHEILKAYSDGANEVIDKIKAEIDEQYDRVHPYDISCAEGLEMALNIVDKYIAEEDKA